MVILVDMKAISTESESEEVSWTVVCEIAKSNSLLSLFHQSKILVEVMVV